MISPRYYHRGLERAITKLFKKWIVRRPHGMCQVLFALTELDDLVDEIVAAVREHEIAEIRILIHGSDDSLRAYS